MNRGVFAGLDIDHRSLQVAVRPAGQKWFANTSDSGISEIADLLAAEDWQASAISTLEQSDILRTIEAICPDAAKSLRGQVQSVLSWPESRKSAIARLRRLPPSRGLEDRGESLALVSCPTLILAAEGDPIHPIECAHHLERLLPNCCFKQIDPKSPLDDQPHLQEVDHAIGEFVHAHLARV